MAIIKPGEPIPFEIEQDIIDWDNYVLDDREYDILYDIYNIYECECKYVFEEVKKKYKNRYKDFAYDLFVFDKLDYIKLSEIKIGLKQSFIKLILSTDKGKKYIKNCITREHEDIVRQHTSLEHGYFIKWVSEHYSNLGIRVETDHDLTRYKTKVGAIEPDMVLYYYNKPYFVECEMGTTSHENMKEKMRKYNKSDLGKVIFICPNSIALEHTKKSVNAWLGKLKYLTVDIHYINASKFVQKKNAKQKLNDIRTKKFIND